MTASALLVTVYSSLISASRAEVYELYGNYYFSDTWKYLAAIGPVILLVSMLTLARSRRWLLLGAMLAGVAAVNVGWQPISEFVLNTSGMRYSTPMDHTRVAAASVATAFVVCLPFRLRGWRLTRRRDTDAARRSKVSGLDCSFTANN